MTSPSSSTAHRRSPSLLVVIAALVFLTALRSVLVGQKVSTTTSIPTDFLDAFVVKHSQVIGDQSGKHAEENKNYGDQKRTATDNTEVVSPIHQKEGALVQDSRTIKREKPNAELTEIRPPLSTDKKGSPKADASKPAFVPSLSISEEPGDKRTELPIADFKANKSEKQPRFHETPIENQLPLKIVKVENTTALLKFCKACQDVASCIEKMTIVNPFDPTEVRQAMTRVAEQDAATCHACHPNSINNCTAYLIQAIGFDQLAPQILNSKSYVTLESIPTDRRIPFDVEAYQQRLAGSSVTSGPLSIYNPSLILIPQSTKISLEGLYAETSTPTYLASFRVTDVGACNILPEFDWRQYGVNLVALAILDQNLEVLDDVLLDINKDVPHLLGVTFEDYRLFDIQGIVYLSHMTFLLPIQVTSKQRPIETMERIIPSASGNQSTATTNLQVSIPAGKLPNIAKIKGAMKGKNFQFFDDVNGTTWVEFWPSPHLAGKLRTDIPVLTVVGSNDNKTAYYPPLDSFAAPRFPSTNDRGSACCIKLEMKYLPNELQEEYKQHDFLYMGISHTRSKKDKKKIYMSRLYTFVPAFPFELVARSGLFCFGSGNMPQPFRGLTDVQQMKLRRVEYDCPNFHYISGMTASISEDTVLIAYGVVDCTSRVVEVSKEEIANVLFTNMNTMQRVV